MDKKNLVIGISLLLGAFALMFVQARDDQHRRATPPQPAAQAAQQQPAPQAHATPANTQTAAIPTLGAPTTSDAPEQLLTLGNDYITVHFTTRGGAIKDVELKRYREKIDADAPVVFNRGSLMPALALALEGPGGGTTPFTPTFAVTQHTPQSVTFTHRSPDGLEISRTYTLAAPGQDDPYVIRNETTFANHGANTLSLNRVALNLGTIPPTDSDPTSEYLNFGYYNGEDAEFIGMGPFTQSSGFLGFGGHEAAPFLRRDISPLVWGSIKNQFFASVLTPDPKNRGTGIEVRPVDLGLKAQDGTPQRGLTSEIGIPIGKLAPGQQHLLGLNYYVGPKEYARLQALGNKQDLVMQFGFFGTISKLLLVAMMWIHGLVVHVSPAWGWGWTIILVTTLIKLALWPLTAIQVRSSKRMAKIQAPLAVIRERYKDDPAKLQQKTMELFKEHRVNPAAGCLPLLIQIPIFFGLFYMLRTASELRFAPFLWISDLSLPDTVGHIASFPIHIMPLLMGITMVIQMRITPMPATDNIQRRMFQFMPFIFLVFCYSFPSGLVLYWTVQNLLTILQQYITNRSTDEEPAPAAPAGGGKTSKPSGAKAGKPKKNK